MATIDEKVRQETIFEKCKKDRSQGGPRPYISQLEKHKPQLMVSVGSSDRVDEKGQKITVVWFL